MDDISFSLVASTVQSQANQLASKSDLLLGRAAEAQWVGGQKDDLTNDRKHATLNHHQDLFVLDRDADITIIPKFEDRIDRLALTNNLSFSNLEFSQRGSKTVIQTEAGETIAKLLGVSINQLSAKDFLTIATQS